MQPLPNFAPRQWNRLFALLSLDGVGALYQEIGLDAASQPEFQFFLRHCIQAARANEKQVIEGAVSSHGLILDCLQTNLGSPHFEAFLSWLQTVFLGNHADQPGLSVWDIALSHWATGKNLPAGVDQSKLGEMTAEYRKATDTAVLSAKISKLKAQPLSEWDLDIYQRHGFNHFDEFKDPYLSIDLMVQMHRVDLLLRDWVSRFSSGELAALRDGAQTVVDMLEVWMPGPVPEIAAVVGM